MRGFMGDCANGSGMPKLIGVLVLVLIVERGAAGRQIKSSARLAPAIVRSAKAAMPWIFACIPATSGRVTRLSLPQSVTPKLP